MNKCFICGEGTTYGESTAIYPCRNEGCKGYIVDASEELIRVVNKISGLGYDILGACDAPNLFVGAKGNTIGLIRIEFAQNYPESMFINLLDQGWHFQSVHNPKDPDITRGTCTLYADVKTLRVGCNRWSVRRVINTFINDLENWVNESDNESVQAMLTIMGYYL